MKRILLTSLAIILYGCLNRDFASPSGKYTSNDDMGVIYFTEDGSFYYKFAAKLDFYDSENLPPNEGKWMLNTVGNLEVMELPENEKTFHFEWYPKQERIILVRDEENGTLPKKSEYEKRG